MRDTAAALPVRLLVTPALGVLVLALGVLTLVAAAGAAAGTESTLHEFFHDARHLLGVPCH